MSGLARRAIVALLAGATGCATTGATVGSGVGDAQLVRPPYYAGVAAAAGDGRVVHLPIAYQRGATQSASFDPPGGAGSAAAALLAEMNDYFDALGATTALRPSDAIPGTPPDVHFGCPMDPGDEDCERARETRPSRRPMRLAVGRPSSPWAEWVASTAARTGAPAVLMLTLETGQYWVRQRGPLGGRKVVDLGTGHTQGVPWLTSLDVPAHVLQITGALVGADGRAIRIGAEGLLARSTNPLVGGIGAQVLLSDDDVRRLRTLRRDDLPGQPLVWQAAIRELVSQLTGRPIGG